MVLPKELKGGFPERGERRVGRRLAAEKFRPAIPRAALHFHHIIRVVRDRPAASHVRAVIRGPKLPFLVELEPERVAKAPRLHSNIAAVRTEAQNGAIALDVAVDDLARGAGAIE